MKKFKKIFAITFIMIFIAGIIPANIASAAGTGTIKINNDAAKTGVSMKGHIYNIYKVFNLSLETGESGNKYSYDVSEEFKNFFESKNTGNKDLNVFAKEYMAENDVNVVAKELMEYATKNNITPAKVTNESNFSEVNKKETVTITGLNLGYYLIVDKGVEGASGNTVIAAASMGTTDKDLEITLKAQAPSIDKEIKHNETGEWGNVGDNQIGDEVEYRFISTVPNVTGYNSYIYTIHDKMTAGLTFNNNVEIYVGEKGTGTLLDKSYYTVDGTPKDGHTFDVNVDIMKLIADKKANQGDKLYIYFSATLNKDAVIAGDSNDNTVNLEYSNNPYDESSKDKTTDVTVKDYTFKLNALKTREDGTSPLQGAEFEIREGNEPLYFTKVGDTYTVCTEKHTHETAETCTKTIVSGENGLFSIVGLDDGTRYTLVETKAPSGYNPIKPIDFTIIASYDEAGNLVSVTTDSSVITTPEGSFELGTTIINKTDSLLPETGGIGTTIFTVVGGAMMLLAAATLIRRRRAS